MMRQISGQLGKKLARVSEFAKIELIVRAEVFSALLRQTVFEGE